MPWWGGRSPALGYLLVNCFPDQCAHTAVPPIGLKHIYILSRGCAWR